MGQTQAFQVPHAGHHHPLYIRYRQQQLLGDASPDGSSSRSQTYSPSDIVATRGAAIATAESEAPLQTMQTSVPLMLPLQTVSTVDASISTPISYDEETGMVQTAVRAIVKHPISTLVDNSVVGLSSTLVIAFGALHEVADCVELQLTHHASSTTEGLAILSLGHFFHYGREAIRQLIELESNEEEDLAASVDPKL